MPSHVPGTSIAPPAPSTAPDMSLPQPDYRARWRAFGRRRLLALTLLYGWLPLLVLLVFTAGRVQNGPELAIVLMLVWTFAVGAAVWWAGEFRCPRCRRRYGSLGREKAVNLSRGLFDRVCYNCKLTKFERTRQSKA